MQRNVRAYAVVATRSTPSAARHRTRFVYHVGDQSWYAELMHGRLLAVSLVVLLTPSLSGAVPFRMVGTFDSTTRGRLHVVLIGQLNQLGMIGSNVRAFGTARCRPARRCLRRRGEFTVPSAVQPMPDQEIDVTFGTVSCVLRGRSMHLGCDSSCGRGWFAGGYECGDDGAVDTGTFRFGLR